MIQACSVETSARRYFAQCFVCIEDSMRKQLWPTDLQTVDYTLVLMHVFTLDNDSSVDTNLAVVFVLIHFSVAVCCDTNFIQ